jgi:membrane protein DedA with SNARE-associated domain
MDDFAQSSILFVQSHHEWAAAIVFVLSFCESFAFVSLFVPATVILFGVGGLIGASGIEFWPVWGAAALGAFAGDWLAYEIAVRFQNRIVQWWPLSRDPALVARGIAFFQRWGVLAVFVGRFFGPLRAVIPIAAGLCRLSRVKFQLANVTSAIVWATGILAPGAIGVSWLVG